MKKPANNDQAWFWTKRWQEGEREADEDIRAGRVHSFDTAEEAIAFLHERVKRAKQEARSKKPLLRGRVKGKSAQDNHDERLRNP